MTLLAKYGIIYTYLLLVMGISFGASKLLRSNEISRNIIHICAGMGWIFYKVLFPATIHPVIISFSFVVLTLVTTKLKIKFVERENGSLGTVFFTLSMFIMSVLGYNNLLLFNIFGVAMICLSCGDAFANIVGSRYGTKAIYMGKSIQGTVACFVASASAMVMLKYSFGIGLSLVAICLLATLCAGTELFSGEYDNIAIPAVLYVSAYIFLTNESVASLLISSSVGVFMFLFAVKLKLLNLPASYMLFLLIFVLVYFGGWRSYIALMLVFAIVILTEKCLYRKTEQIFSSMNKEHGVRNERQLLANCLVATIAVSLYGITESKMYLLAFFAAIAEAIGDSVASEIGVLSKADPIDICSFKKVPKGVSGGVSIVGTGAALAVCLYSGLVYMALYKGDFYGFIVILVSSLAGIILDSVLGSRVQVQYKCTVCGKLTEKEIHCQKPTDTVKGWEFLDNTRVNLICNVFAFGLACLLMTAR